MKVCIGFFQHTTPPMKKNIYSVRFSKMQFNIGRYSEREKLHQTSSFKIQKKVLLKI